MHKRRDHIPSRLEEMIIERLSREAAKSCQLFTHAAGIMWREKGKDALSSST